MSGSWGDFQREVEGAMAAAGDVDPSIYKKVRSTATVEVYEITNPEAVAHLTDLQHAAIATGGDIPFGYRVDGPTVYIYTD